MGADSTPPTTRDPNSVSPPAKTKRDKWDRIEILGKAFAGLVAGLTVASIGFFGQRALSDRNHNAMFTQLMSQREQAESDLRGSMFTTILGQFFEARNADAGPADANEKLRQLSEKLLKLELLALNFGESMTLSPLFRELDREITKLDKNTSDFLVEVELEDLSDRLDSLARRVSDWQLSVLAAKGAEFPFGEPYDNTGQVDIIHPGPDEYDEISVEGITRGIRVEVTDIDEKNHRVRVALDVVRVPGYEYELPKRTFQLDYFDFPMIDNTRLADGHRLALVLRHVGPDDDGQPSLEITGVCFPGVYTSQRDKPVFGELLTQLKESQKEGE